MFHCQSEGSPQNGVIFLCAREGGLDISGRSRYRYRSRSRSRSRPAFPSGVPVWLVKKYVYIYIYIYIYIGVRGFPERGYFFLCAREGGL